MGGLVHIYYGDGKGKTTAAMGLCLRAVAAGYSMIIMQFMKNGTSGEIDILRNMQNVTVYANHGIESVFDMNQNEMEACIKQHFDNFNDVMKLDKGDKTLVLFDEIFGAIKRGLFDEALLVDYILSKGGEELVLTGREPSERILKYGDYITEMKKVAHPYDCGVFARDGIER